MEHRRPHMELYNVPFTIDDFNGMPYRRLGRSGLRVPAVGLGTWKMGYPETGDGSRVGEKEALKIFDRAVELGVTFWDTANRYNAASGNSERVIGTWMKKNSEQRRNIVLATKVFGGMDGSTPNHSRLSRGNILDSVYACLERLQVDSIDLLYFHGYDKDTPVDESLQAVEDLIRQDLVRYFGVSNFSTEMLAEYGEAEEQLSSRCRVVAVQNRTDILNGEFAPNKGVLEYCKANNLSLIPHTPLATGLLTERYLDAAKVGPGKRLFDEGNWKDISSDDQLMDRLQKLASLAHEWGYALNQLTIAYMLSIPAIGALIPSSTSLEQLESNAAAGRIKLTEEQIGKVREIASI